MQPRVVIAERNPSGHRLLYLRLLIQGCGALHCRPVLIVRPEVTESSEFSKHLRDLEGEFDLISYSSEWSLRQLQMVASQSGARLLVLPDGNLYALEAALHPGPKLNFVTRLLVMRDPRWEFEGPRVPPLRSLAKERVLRLAEKRAGVELFWLREPGAVSELEKHANDPVILDGTPAELAAEGDALRRRLGMSRQVFWYGLTGVLSDAKISLPLMEGIRIASLLADAPIGLALIGPVVRHSKWPTSGILSALPDSVPVVIDDRLLSNREVGAAICSLDCVIAAYSKNIYGPSSIVGKAVALGVKSVTAASPSTRRMSDQMTGMKNVPLTAHALGIALDRARNCSGPPKRLDVGHEQFVSALLAI